MTPLPILYEDEYYVAIDKPIDILVHRTGISEDATFLLQQLRKQLKRRVYPVHRLDRATSGVLVWAKNGDAAGRLSRLFKQRQVSKTYLAIVRGWTEDEGLVDYPLPTPHSAGEPLLSAETAYRTWMRSEMPWAIGNRYATARFSLVWVFPKTGRWHQIRRHFSHLRHPIIGDRRYGDNKHNKFFKEQLGIARLLLHAWKLSFPHPYSGLEIHIEAPLDDAFRQAIRLLSLTPPEDTFSSGSDGAQPCPT
jgi:tRNA pseudouridine65 synthase